ncbi:MAG: EVE domain-containing protein [Gemmatimonadales bacterium]|jgi:predicted RNA-binding protein with PUA-like domain
MSTSRRDRRYWLVKTEPGSFSFQELLASPDRITCWDGVRNFQARNFMRDDMTVGDLVFFYHSNADPAAIVGVAEVVRAAYPDSTAFDPSDPHFDPKSRREAPTWMMVDLRAVEPLDRPLALSDLRGVPGLEKMTLLQRGSRLSVQPVTAAEWAIVHRLGMKPLRSRATRASGRGAK